MRATKVEVGVLLPAIAAAIGLRLWLSSRGHNYDMESWTIVSQIARDGGNVYLSTDRYNYGPIWFVVLGALRHLHDLTQMQRLGPESFHIAVAAFLSFCDVGISALLFRRYGIGPALVFLLNPLSILLTGHHSQIENLALLPGLMAWLLIEPAGGSASGDASERQSVRWVLSAVLLGVSLAAKHILIFFPIWVMVCPAILKARRRRLAYAAIAYGVFAGTFVPFILSEGALGRAYHSFFVHPALPDALMPQVINLFIPSDAVDSLFGLLQRVSILKIVFVGCMLMSGLLIAFAKPHALFFCYLLSMLIFAPTIGDQYFAIPIIACAVHYRNGSAWMYLGMAAVIVETVAQTQRWEMAPKPWWHNSFPSGLRDFQAASWLIVLFISITVGWKRIVRGISAQFRTLIAGKSELEKPSVSDGDGPRSTAAPQSAGSPPALERLRGN